MIIVTGTKRSGTSMWMQILAAAGLPVIGERVPRHWGEQLNAANPDGFYESELVAGIYFRTNPHPVSGVFLFPDQTEQHAVKVFIPGLIRTDLAYIDRVIATVRGWRDFARSRERLRALGRAGEVAEGPNQAPSQSPILPPALEWWAENFALIRDVATRRYPVHMLSYESLLADPERTIREVLGWLGVGDAVKASAVVHREGSAAARDGAVAEVDETGLEPAQLLVLDELHDHIHRGLALSPGFVERLNQVDRELRPRLLEHNAAVKAAALLELARAPHGG
ncbi:hypothetical protein [Nannocystis sp.]|uniref:hypothetical protein n=1 Tax=Nannocystis sp. TaxID=1962667 RepID=UPI002421E96B|nr:hypothetical protein [Nannocystis sp.]MBK7830128.1 hypothetical protein [Nannocystis sp.]MBK9752109.1 hypothetical protein [Nannocystis sp.]